MDLSPFPNWIGHVRQRAVRLDGDRLPLGTAAPVRIDGLEVDAVLLRVRAGR